MGQPAIELVGPSDVDRARVALVVADAADEGAARVVKAIQRGGVPRVVLVAAHFDEAGVIAAVAAGVTAFLRRSDASTAKLVEVIRQTDEGGCQLPDGLLRKAASAPGGPGSPVVRDPGSGGLAVRPASASDPVVSCDEVPDQVIDLRDVSNGAGADMHLDQRETQILRLVAAGLDTSDIAEHLSYSESTIKGVLAKLMSRLDARNRCHVVAIVVREGLI